MRRLVHFSIVPLVAGLAACGGGSDPAAPSADPAQAATASASPAPVDSQGAASPPASASSSVPAEPALAALQSCGLAGFQQELLARINEARGSSRSCGTAVYKAAPPVSWNSTLYDAAAAHATDMAGNNYFSHSGLDGSTFDQRLTAAGYGWSAAGENIAAGQVTVAQVMSSWLQSPGHCANIMNGNFTEVGVACTSSTSASYKTYWAMELGRPTS